MTKAKNEYNEIDQIRDDLDSLKTNVIGLTRHLQEDGIEKAVEMTDELKKSTIKAAGKLAARGERQLSQLEKQVKANPGKSVLAAFATGMIASMLLSRKS